MQENGFNLRRNIVNVVDIVLEHVQQGSANGFELIEKDLSRGGAHRVLDLVGLAVPNNLFCKAVKSMTAQFLIAQMSLEKETIESFRAGSMNHADRLERLVSTNRALIQLNACTWGSSTLSSPEETAGD